jgi:uncharacterized protein (TIGR03492 family)
VKRLLVISNGIGEDSVGAELVRRLPKDVIAEAYPTLGEGRHYSGVCPIVGPRAKLPSEGSRVDRGTILRDIAGGLLRTIGPGLKFLRSVKATYDEVLVIGDFVGVGACWLAGIRRIVWVDVYNSGYARGYHPIEKAIVRRTCRAVFCRHPSLADSLRRPGLDARASGNVMMDTIASGQYPADQRRLRLQAVTLLPGSRETTAANFALQVDAITQLPAELRPDVFVAVAEGITPEQLGEAANMFVHPPPRPGSADLGRLSGRGLHINLARGALGDLIEVSDVVLSQAGTGTVQAVGLGRPVLTFVRDTDRHKRVEEENRLFGQARETVPADATSLSTALRRLLLDKNERQRRSEIGKQRIGGPGVIDEIIGCLRGQPAEATAPASP